MERQYVYIFKQGDFGIFNLGMLKLSYRFKTFKHYSFSSYVAFKNETIL